MQNIKTRIKAGVYVFMSSSEDQTSIRYPAKNAVIPKPTVPQTLCLPYPISPPSPEILYNKLEIQNTIKNLFYNACRYNNLKSRLILHTQNIKTNCIAYRICNIESYISNG